MLTLTFGYLSTVVYIMCGLPKFDSAPLFLMPEEFTSRKVVISEELKFW